MRWALAFHPDQFLKGHLVQTPKNIPEDAIPTAVAQGWIVLGTDTEVLMQPLGNVPAQSNPHRDHGYGAVRDREEDDER